MGRHTQKLPLDRALLAAERVPGVGRLVEHRAHAEYGSELAGPGRRALGERARHEARLEAAAEGLGRLAGGRAAGVSIRSRGFDCCGADHGRSEADGREGACAAGEQQEGAASSSPSRRHRENGCGTELSLCAARESRVCVSLHESTVDVTRLLQSVWLCSGALDGGALLGCTHVNHALC